MTTHNQWTQFRNRLYQMMGRRADAAMDLIDALAANQGCSSVVALSEAPQFRRGHDSVTRAIDEVLQGRKSGNPEDQVAREQWLRQPIAPLLTLPPSGEHWVFSVDATPMSRPHARTLGDRGWVHQAQPVGGRAPVTVGHEYSIAMALPERQQGEPVWALPIAVRRVATTTTAQTVAAEQVRAIVLDHGLPMFGQTMVVVGDSHYSQAGFLVPLTDLPNLVAITRLRKNRVLHRQPAPPAPGQRGRHRTYGERIEPGTLGSLEAADASCCPLIRMGPRKGRVTLHRWNNVILKGESEGRVVIQVADVIHVLVQGEDGKPLYREDMVLATVGDRRHEVTLEQAFAYYRRRFDQEHSHRFMRGHLLLDAFQSPETAREERWVTLTMLAFQTLFATRNLVQLVRRPWEPKPKTHVPIIQPLGPSQVQRDMARIFCQLGTPARPPQTRGISPGWVAGTPGAPRKSCPVVKRGPPIHGKLSKVA